MNTENPAIDENAFNSTDWLKSQISVPSLCDCMLELFKDPNLFLMYDRAYQKTLRNKVRGKILRDREVAHSLLQYQLICSRIARNWLDEFSKKRPEYLYFISAPHNFQNYIRGKVAEYLGIPIYIGLESRVAGYAFIGKGFGRTPHLEVIDPSLQNHAYSSDANSYIEKSKRDYTSAMPEYEKSRLLMNRGRYFSLKQQIKKHWTRPEYILNSWRCWREMRRQSQPLDEVQSPYVIFFPHYQPERTSLPEGYGFTQQAFAVLALREALPEEVRLLVKEHPSIFTLQCSPFVRWPGFYTDISAHGGIDWVNIESDNFALIDGALATATISGTVGTESLLRGVPTIVFGIMKWADSLGQHHYEELTKLKSFVSGLTSGIYEKKAVRNAIINTILETESRFAIATDERNSHKWVNSAITQSRERIG